MLADKLRETEGNLGEALGDLLTDMEWEDGH